MSGIPIDITKLLAQLGASSYENARLREVIVARDAEIAALKLRLNPKAEIVNSADLPGEDTNETVTEPAAEQA